MAAIFFQGWEELRINTYCDVWNRVSWSLLYVVSWAIKEKGLNLKTTGVLCSIIRSVPYSTWNQILRNLVGSSTTSVVDVQAFWYLAQSRARQYHYAIFAKDWVTTNKDMVKQDFAKFQFKMPFTLSTIYFAGYLHWNYLLSNDPIFSKQHTDDMIEFRPHIYICPLLMLISWEWSWRCYTSATRWELQQNILYFLSHIDQYGSIVHR